MDSNMENRFKDELFKIYDSKKDAKKSQLLSKSDYELFLAEILEAKLANPKSDRQRLVSKKYDVLECGDVQKVIKKQNSESDEIKYFVPLEQMFDVIKKAHMGLGQFPPGQFPPGQFPPDNSPLDNSPRRTIPPCAIPPEN